MPHADEGLPVDRLEHDRYSAAHWSGRPSRRRPTGPERRAQAALDAAGARGMTASTWLALAAGVASVAVVTAFARWSAWWPHSDNRQNGVKLLGTVAGVVGLVALSKVLIAAPWPTRLAVLLAAGAAAAAGMTIGYALMVDATAWAK